MRGLDVVIIPFALIVTAEAVEAPAAITSLILNLPAEYLSFFHVDSRGGNISTYGPQRTCQCERCGSVE